MSQVQLSPELARGVLPLARVLLIATRKWSLYLPEHATVRTSLSKLAEAIRQSWERDDRGEYGRAVVEGHVDEPGGIDPLRYL